MLSGILYIHFMKVILTTLGLVLLTACNPVKLSIKAKEVNPMGGASFYKQAAAMKWEARDSFVLKEVFAGNIPGFLKKFVAIYVSISDSTTGKEIKATYYVAPDYLSVGNDNDWARVNITPNAAQQIADSFHCFLPTRKITDDIYKAAKVKLEPVPLFAYRDSTPVMWQHHLIIEGQRKGRLGLIAGIKKDVVISGFVPRHSKPDRVAIYGWHKPDGKPIQPLYAGHVNWYVDYSHGIRLVYRKIKVNGKWMDYTAVMADTLLRGLLCDEANCDFLRY
jgi:hypothetical protein